MNILKNRKVMAIALVLSCLVISLSNRSFVNATEIDVTDTDINVEAEIDVESELDDISGDETFYDGEEPVSELITDEDVSLDVSEDLEDLLSDDEKLEDEEKELEEGSQKEFIFDESSDLDYQFAGVDEHGFYTHYHRENGVIETKPCIFHNGECVYCHTKADTVTVIAYFYNSIEDMSEDISENMSEDLWLAYSETEYPVGVSIEDIKITTTLNGYTYYIYNGFEEEDTLAGNTTIYLLPEN